MAARTHAFGLLAMTSWALGAAEGPADPPPTQTAAPLPQITVEAPEPRFVAPTRRDKVGRIWAPVLINGQGPFRLVLDTGANSSAVNASVAQILGLAPDANQSMLLRGVTGSVVVPTIHVDLFVVGDVIVTPATLPIVTDALGGADGVLGTEGFADKRLYIDFRHDLITVTYSRATRAQPDFFTIPFELSSTGLLMTRARVGGVRVHAIIDTGGQATIGNEAMRQALIRRQIRGTHDQVIDVTTTSQDAESFPSPPIEMGSIQIQGARITYGDMHIFEHWHLINEPALLIGMDALGLLDVFIIDYRRHELQLRTHSGRQ
jgi:predicted aspartyl protease